MHGLAAGGPVEGLGHRGPPVDHQGFMIRSRHGQPADVERLTEYRSVARAVPMAAPGLREAVDPPEVERLVADVELFQPGQAGPHHDVPFRAGLEGTALPEVQHPLQHLPGFATHEVQAVMGAIKELLLRLQIRMVRHRAPFSPRPPGKRFIISDRRRAG